MRCTTNRHFNVAGKRRYQPRGLGYRRTKAAQDRATPTPLTYEDAWKHLRFSKDLAGLLPPTPRLWAHEKGFFTQESYRGCTSIDRSRMGVDRVLKPFHAPWLTRGEFEETKGIKMPSSQRRGSSARRKFNYAQGDEPCARKTAWTRLLLLHGEISREIDPRRLRNKEPGARS